MYPVTRRDFIKLSSLLPVALFLKPSNVLACPLCFLVVDVLLGWAERGVAIEALEAVALGSGVRSVVAGGIERAVVRSAFSDIAKQRVLTGFRVLGKTEETASILVSLDALAKKRPDLVESFNQYENDVQAWWFVKNSNEIFVDVVNPNHSDIEAKLLIRAKNKETGDYQLLFKELITVFADKTVRFPFSVPQGALKQQGVKDIVIEIGDVEQTGIRPIIKTVFVV